MARIYCGTSGWAYRGWREHLYAEAPVRRWLEVAPRAFSSLEINGSFYTQISPATYARWRDETPSGFRFAVKGHRFVTHYRRLRDCGDSSARSRPTSFMPGCTATPASTPRATAQIRYGAGLPMPGAGATRAGTCSSTSTMMPRAT